MRIIIFLFFISNSSFVFSQKIKKSEEVFSLQPDTLFVSKESCNCDFDGYLLRINESKKVINEKECADFSYNLLYTASIDQKIRIIEDLLKFENDSSLSCSRVKSYSSAFKKYSHSFQSERYSIQISALFHINLICFGQFAPFKYSPFPVLINCYLNKEINLDTQSISEVFQIYKEWFKSAKKAGFHGYSFPLFGTKYRWKFGDYSKSITFEQLPEISSDMKYRIGRPY